MKKLLESDPQTEDQALYLQQYGSATLAAVLTHRIAGLITRLGDLQQRCHGMAKLRMIASLGCCCQ